MSILIKGMEMPTSCHECVAGYGGCCFVAPAEADGICPDHGRADFCPLVPVPPHGDLIERKAICLTDFEIVMCDGDYKEGMKMLLDKAESAPTIIPAEEGK